MSDIETGGPAFPTRDNDNGYYGMSLRDYFAAKAMQSMLSLMEVQVALGKKDVKLDTVANASYEWADAMLKARQK